MSILNDAIYSSRSLENISTTPINNLAGNLLSRKRKRDGELLLPKSVQAPQKSCSDTLLPGTQLPVQGNVDKFTIKTLNNDKTLSFCILTIISRAQLPLSFIDTSTSPNRLFSCHLPQLDANAQSTPHVLIATPEPSQTTILYAVERVGHGTYALCRLAAGLKLEHILALKPTTPSTAHAPRNEIDLNSDSLNIWWHVAEQKTLPTRQGISLTKAPRLILCPTIQDSIKTLPQPESEHKETTAPGLMIEETAPDVLIEETADQVFERFIKQYLDALYLTKTSLAFFTKGPLSRLRAAFTGTQVTNTTLTDLVQFLRSLIYPSSTADKKYRDKLPELLTNLPLQSAEQEHTPKAKKKRRKRRLRPDKSGLLPDEADYFAKWWYQDDAAAVPNETAEQSLKRRAAHLRTRETLMHVVLSLEVLSLEALPAFKSEIDDQSKSKKSNSLTLSLEILVDKLCIWHSLHTGDLLSTSVKPDKTAEIELHSFCVNVILPFFMSRIPEHAASVNKKLGGPATSKPKTTRKPSLTDIKPAIDKTSRRSFQRVATESFARSEQTPRSFSRSATDSELVHIKRETPDISLASIPMRRDSQPQLTRKSQVLEKHRLRQREVDFGAIAAANETKAKKRQEVEQKLKDAISTLKKPSRATVSGEFVDAIEQRKRMAEGRARPPLSKRTSSSVFQVAATPRNTHKTTAITATPHRIPGPSFTQTTASSSGPSVVPSSNVKQKSLSFAHFPPVHEVSDDEQFIPATDTRQRHKNALKETPIKSRVSFDPQAVTLSEEQPRQIACTAHDRGNSSPLRESPTLLKTPSKPQRPRFSVTPSKPTPPLNLGKPKNMQAVIPVKTFALPLDVSVVEASDSSGNKAAIGTEPIDQGNDIYAALGWDDDDDDND